MRSTSDNDDDLQECVTSFLNLLVRFVEGFALQRDGENEETGRWAKDVESGASELLRRFVESDARRRARAVAESRARRLQTNDLVVLRGGLARDDARALVVNGLESISLSRREFLFLLALAQDPQKPLWALDEFCQAGYIPMEQLLKRVVTIQSRWLKAAGFEETEEFWVLPMPEDVRRLVNAIRAKLGKVGVNTKLLETGADRCGYRLSTPRRQISIELSGVGIEGLFG
ncbi:MAG: hypothetical protein GWP08_01635 [Nitrospiraceae bacterium]|nr:hypothetical protein [Nitrospiraceae bacterium]